MARPRSLLRILLSEGASTSAREAVTALGLGGHHIEVMDPDPHCICRFSRFVARVHRCPPVSGDPKAYLAFTLDLLGRQPFDVLLPIHEQGLVFAKAAHRLPKTVGVALPSFAAYETGLDKAYFSRLLAELGVPQPKTQIVQGPADIPKEGFPFVVKRPMGTASRHVYMIRAVEDMEKARAAEQSLPGPLLVQELIDAPLEHGQSVFDHGRLVGMHFYRQIVRGAGGGEAIKESVWRPQVRAEIEKVARHLDWHGALSVDYLLKEEVPYFIDCNPRLVEPMSAHFAGLDLAGLLVAVSRGEHPPEAPPGRPGIRTRLSLQALLGIATKTRSRVEIVREIFRILTGTGLYAGSREELTPVSLDWMAVIPVAAAAMAVLVHPGSADILPKSGWGAGLLTPEAIRIIREEID